MRQFLEAARKRGLDKIAVAYVVGAWAAIQGVAMGASAFDWQPWILRAVIVLGVAGLPIVLIGVWAVSVRAEHGSLKPSRIDLQLLGALGVLLLVAGTLLVSVFWPSGKPVEAASATAVPPAFASIAVLPFANLSGDSSKAYFSEGIADQLISELARMPKVAIAARTSSFAFEGKNTDIKTIARALNVRTVVEGSVREDGKRVRIAAQLVNASDGFQIWSQTYDRDLTDILSLQDEIARSIASALTQRLLGRAQTVAARPTRTVAPEAYKDYLQGQFYYAARTDVGIARSIDLFQKAVDLQPDYADGYAALGSAHATYAFNLDKTDHIPAAEAALKKALALDPDNEAALEADSTVALLKWDWRRAKADLDTLHARGVRSADLWHIESLYYAFMGLPQRAAETSARAVEQDPLSLAKKINLAYLWMDMQAPAKAIAVSNDALVLQPGNSDALSMLCYAQSMLKNFAAAETVRKELAAQAASSGNPSDLLGCEFRMEVFGGDTAKARALVEGAEKTWPANGLSADSLATGFRMVDDFDKALKWYAQSYNSRELEVPGTEYFAVGSTRLFADPRWKAFRDKPDLIAWEAARAELVTKQPGE